MDDAPQDIVRLRPSFLRASVVLTGTFIFGLAFEYFREGCFEGHWWTHGYDLTLVIPMTVFLVFLWFAAVPKSIEFSAREFKIKFRLGRPHNFSWDELDLYGWARAFL
jgi:hypothetical protein